MLHVVSACVVLKEKAAWTIRAQVLSDNLQICIFNRLFIVMPLIILLDARSDFFLEKRFTQPLPFQLHELRSIL